LQYGKNPKESPDFPRIIRESDVKRLSDYLKCGELFYGGEVKIKDKYVSPTILKNVDLESPIMQEEIFGPIFPTLTFEKLDNIIDFIEEKEKPLALYYFSESREKIEYILSNTSSGGVTINDTVIHVATPSLPFGGVGNSGMGAYHGEESYLTFSHKKSVLVRGTFIEFPIRFAPFKNKLQLLRKVMK
ncbi:MAG: aldehyde dehydrogenase family protein, partial [Clostridium sp.]